MSSEVDFYFDLLSPYSYVAYHLLNRVKDSWSVTIYPKPVSLPHIMKLTGNTPPGRVEPKGRFLRLDLKRTCQMHRIPFNTSLLKSDSNSVVPGEEFETTHVNRLVCAVIKEHGKSTAWSLIGSLWDQLWGKGNRHIFRSYTTPEIKAILLELSIDGNSLEPDKVSYITNTEQCIQAGAFGVPTMTVRKKTDNGASKIESKQELFFGSDRFDHIADFLGTDPCILHCKQAESKL